MRLTANIIITIIAIFGLTSLYSQGFRTPSKGKAIVYIVRINTGGALATLSFFNNDKFIGDIKKQNYLIYECDPGKQTFYRAGMNWDEGEYVTYTYKFEEVKNTSNILRAISNDEFDEVTIKTNIDQTRKYTKPHKLVISADLKEGGTYIITYRISTNLKKEFLPISIKDSKEFNKAKKIILKKKPVWFTTDDKEKAKGLVYPWLKWNLKAKNWIPFHHITPDMAIPPEFFK